MNCIKKTVTALLVAAVCLFSSVAFTACDAIDRVNSAYKDSTSSGSAGDSSSGESLPVTRPAVDEKLINNVESLTVGQIKEAIERNEFPAELLFSGIAVGDMIKFAGLDVMSYEYHDDGSWYTLSGIKFTPVMNALFSYEPFTFVVFDKDCEFENYYDEKLIDLFSRQFSLKFDNLISGTLPQGVYQLADCFINMTVRQFKGMTEGDFAFIASSIASCDVSAVIDTAVIAAKAAGVNEALTDSVAALLKDVVSGTLGDIRFNETVKICEVADDLCGIVCAARPEIAVKAEALTSLINGLYGDELLINIVDATSSLTAIDRINFIEDVDNVLYPETAGERAELYEVLRDLFTEDEPEEQPSELLFKQPFAA